MTSHHILNCCGFHFSFSSLTEKGNFERCYYFIPKYTKLIFGKHIFIFISNTAIFFIYFMFMELRIGYSLELFSNFHSNFQNVKLFYLFWKLSVQYNKGNLNLNQISIDIFRMILATRFCR